MFFLYKKQYATQSIHLGTKPNNILSKRHASLGKKIIFFTRDLVIINAYLLPMYFIVKEWRAFLLVYRFRTFRNNKSVLLELKHVRLKYRYQTFLLPTKEMPSILKFLFSNKIPFHFENTVVGTKRYNHLHIYKIIMAVYGSIRLNYYNKCLNKL